MGNITNEGSRFKSGVFLCSRDMGRVIRATLEDHLVDGPVNAVFEGIGSSSGSTIETQRGSHSSKISSSSNRRPELDLLDIPT